MPPRNSRSTTSRLLAGACSLALLLSACGKGDDTAAGTKKAGASADSAAAPVVAGKQRVARPDSMRALYVNAWAAGSRSRMAELLRIADETEVNAFIVDIKESDTFLSYDSTAIALAKEIGADQRPATKWLPALVDSMNAHGIYSVARIVVFKDRMLAEKKPEFAIRNTSGGLWRDKKGGAWVNPYDKRVWDYNIAIA
ncbi:MAG TPA: putative glycoside hydrolase, partial [Gemmatimonadaceae bacterium]|nr:putative glycoside hydrolase [Gemmatimonadaceae bacterium]